MTSLQDAVAVGGNVPYVTSAHALEAPSGSLAEVARSPSAHHRRAHHSHRQEQGSTELWKIFDIKATEGESAEALLSKSNKQFCQFMQTKMEISEEGHVLKCVACQGGMTVVTQGLTAEEFQEKFVPMCHEVAGK